MILQRQAATFKQVLRKQLDKISQPKVLPPEMHFIPNPSNAEFICYIGLESVVDYLTGNNTTQQPPDPFECVQCGTDFTPVWKWQDRTDPSKPSVICEKCVSKNVKKIALEEYNKEVNNFSKIYDELEKQFASTAGALTPPSAALSPSLASSSVSSQRSSTNNIQPHAPSATNLYGNNAAAAAVAAANLSLATSLQQQAHSNTTFSSLTPQMAAMAFLMSQSTNTGSSNQLSTPPAAHSSSRASNSNYNNSNLSSALTNNASSSYVNNVNSATSAQTAALALLQQISKFNNPTQSLLLAQQLGALSGANSSTTNNAAAMAQLLSFPNLFYSNLMNSFTTQKASNNSSATSSTPQSSTLNAMAGFQRQMFQDMFPNAASSSQSRSGHSSNASSMQHHNWKS